MTLFIYYLLILIKQTINQQSFLILPYCRSLLNGQSTFNNISSSSSNSVKVVKVSDLKLRVLGSSQSPANQLSLPIFPPNIVSFHQILSS